MELRDRFVDKVDFKNYLKSLSTEIKQLRRNGQPPESVHFISQWYRNLHIAYCMIGGTRYSRIEPKVQDGNRPQWLFIRWVMKRNPPKSFYATVSS